MQNFYINIPFDKSNAKGTIYNNFNYEISELLYSSLDDNDIPVIYNFTYKYIKSLKSNLRPIVFSPDYSISSSTCSAIAERYIEKNEENGMQHYSSPLKIIYFTSTAHIKELENISALDFSKSIISNILDQNKISYTKHNFIIPSEQIFMIGLNDNLISQDDVEKMKLNKIKYFTFANIKKKGIDNICQFLIDEICDDPVYVIYDMSVLSFESSPCVFRVINKEKEEEKLNGLSTSDIISFFNKLKPLNIVGLDITGFNLKKETPDIPFKITSNTAKLALVNLLGIKEKKINIFNESTKIIICKPISIKQKVNWETNKNTFFPDKEERKKAINKIQEELDEEDIIFSSEENKEGEGEKDYNYEDDDKDDEYDFGWYVMRGIPTELKEELIKKLMEVEDNIISYKIEEEDMYISFTTIEEQESKSYYSSTCIQDRILTPGEKVNLVFSQL
jgi:arginase family enzyme